MGLCKCPRKKVTNLFCFEHRVNVCEHCIVGSHSSCVVQSYLAWLQDSDYDPNCSLCGLSLSEAGKEPCRLLCLHLFHWDCLERWGRAFPPTTAPGGFRCPLCQDPVFPRPNHASPIAEALKAQLQNANWARAGLGLPLLPELMPANGTAAPVHPTAPPPGSALPPPIAPQTQLVRKGGTERPETPITMSPAGGDKDADLAENKYKRRSATDWLRRLIKSRQKGHGSGDPLSGYKRIFFILLLIVIGIITFITIATRAAQSTYDGRDPFLQVNVAPNLALEADN